MKPIELPKGATRHPWNDGFSWSLPESDSHFVDAEQKAAFDRDGFVVLPDLFDGATIDNLTAELDHLESQVEQFLVTQEEQRVNIAEAGAITFTVHAVLRSAAARAFAQHTALVGLCADLLGPDVNFYWDQAVYKKPEKPRRFPWHQDTGYTFVLPQQYLTCWVALTDATLDNGCPWVLPGAHRLGTLLHHWVEPIGWECFTDDPPGAVPAAVSAGGAVVFSSLTPHLTGPNLTEPGSADSVRKAYIVQYATLGTHTIQGEWETGESPSGRTPCDDPDRQFAVLRNGTAV